MNAEVAQSVTERWFSENQVRIEGMGLRTSFERTNTDGMGHHARITFESENIAAEALVFYEGSVAFSGGAVEPAIDFIPPDVSLGSIEEKLDAALNTIAGFI